MRVMMGCGEQTKTTVKFGREWKTKKNMQWMEKIHCGQRAWRSIAWSIEQAERHCVLLSAALCLPANCFRTSNKHDVDKVLETSTWTRECCRRLTWTNSYRKKVKKESEDQAEEEQGKETKIFPSVQPWWAGTRTPLYWWLVAKWIWHHPTLIF